MQDKEKAKKAKNKRALVYKPYLKGNRLDGAALKRSLRLVAYFFMFAFLFLVVGSALQFGNSFLRVLMNVLMVLVCAAIVYMDGARLGETEVAYGEIALGRKEAGKPVDEKEKERCYHPLKGVMIALWAALPVFALCLPPMTTMASHTAERLAASSCRLSVARHIVSWNSTFVHLFFIFSQHSVKLLRVCVV